MEKRYQVFVSSTYEDLHEERREVMQALLTLDCIPTGMELFPAADEDSWTHIQRFIAGCDYYIVIVGGRYGSKGPNGKSYTEMEYDYAVEVGIPAIAFLHKDPGSIPASKTEPNDEGRTSLAAFRTKIESARLAKYWNSSGNLAGTVALSMSSLMKTKPRVGWVRADLVPDESSAQEMLKLKKKIEELEASIAANDLRPPLGSEGLAQGDETIQLHFKYETTNQFLEAVESYTWNELLSLLGPLLILETTEKHLKDELAIIFMNRQKERLKEVVYGGTVRNEDFQRIKLQFRALGIIREHVQETAAGRNHSWILTPFGDRLVTQVAAIRSSSKS